MNNMTLYKKAYLIEVFNAKTRKITDAFCFSVPPENEELTYTQRISQTKTFGGICVDRYGKDAVKISLSGSTINQESRYIYRSSLAAQNMTGEQEIYYLRDLLENVADDKNSEIRLYDLSKSSPKGSGVLNGNYITNWWVVYLDSFKIKRSKERPLAYTYQIEFTGEPKIGRTTFKFDLIKVKNAVDGTTSIVQKVKNSTSSILTHVDNGISKMRLGLNAMEKALSGADNFLNQIYKVRNRVDEFTSVFSDYADALQNFHTFKDKAVQEVVKVGTDIIKSFTSAGIDISRGVLATGQLLKDSVDVFKELYDGFSEVQWKDCYSEEKLNALQTTFEELKDSTTVAFNEILEGNNEIQANMKKMVMPEVLVNTDQNGNDYPVVSYGYKTYTMKDGDSFEKLAYDFYGTTDYIPLLIRYNEISDFEIETGAEIKIPVLEPETKDLNNNIYEVKESLGTDLQLSESGDIQTFGGDTKPLSGEENLKQSIEVRLSAFMGSNVRNVLYGLRNTTGDNQASNAYLMASLEQTLLEEPRIAEINKIEYLGRGDHISIHVDYTNIKNVRETYQGVI